MARARDPKRDEAKKIWLQHDGNITNRRIAGILEVDEKKIAVWKQRDKWNVVQQSESNVVQQKKKGAPKGNKNAVGNKGGAPKGNQNAKGNRGGVGGPVGNKKAVRTGEYEAIWFDTLEDDEQELLTGINTDPEIQADEAIALLSIRERRMLQRIQKLTGGLSEKQRRVLQELMTTKEPVQVHDEKSGKANVVMTSRKELVTTEVEETEFRAIEDILRIEEALTRVQDKKAKWVELKHKIVGEERRLRIEKMKADIERTKVDVEKTRYESEKLKKGTGSQEPLKIIIDYGDVDEPEVDES